MWSGEGLTPSLLFFSVLSSVVGRSPRHLLRRHEFHRYWCSRSIRNGQQHSTQCSQHASSAQGLFYFAETKLDI